MDRNIWVISDTHFNHTNIINYCDRPFNSTKHMNEMLVSNINEVVKEIDILYHLGDVYFNGSNEELNQTWYGKLHGRKRLVLGNHDNGKDQKLNAMFAKITVWRLFSEFGLLLTHVPVHETSLYRGKTGNEKDPKKLLNVHGHIHTSKSPSSDHKCVCVEQTNYYPVNIEDLRVW